MTEAEASALLVRMEQSWPSPRWGQALIDVWRDDLALLDAGHAGTAFVRLRQTHSQRPSYAEFIAEYRALARFDGSTKKADCSACGNSGWVEGRATADGYTAVSACHCEHGATTRALHEKYVRDEQWR